MSRLIDWGKGGQYVWKVEEWCWRVEHPALLTILNQYRSGHLERWIVCLEFPQWNINCHKSTNVIQVSWIKPLWTNWVVQGVLEFLMPWQLILKSKSLLKMLLKSPGPVFPWGNAVEMKANTWRARWLVSSNSLVGSTMHCNLSKINLPLEMDWFVGDVT